MTIILYINAFSQHHKGLLGFHLSGKKIITTVKLINQFKIVSTYNAKVQ